jgi:hypothetical protein
MFSPGVGQLRVVAMSASTPKGGFSAGVLGVILRGICGPILAKSRSTRREGGDRHPMALSLALGGRYTLCRNASDYAEIGRYRTTEALSAASASST